MELRHLRYALALAEHGHFGRAASSLGIAQPPLSVQIKALEAEVGARLFDRARHGVVPTAAGRAFLERAGAALREVDRAAVEAGQAGRGETGRLAVGFIGSAMCGLLPAVLAEFRRAHPGVTVEPVELPSTDQLTALVDGRLDVGFICGPPPARLRTVIGTAPVDREPLAAALPADHPLAGGPAVRTYELADETLIVPDRDLEPAAVTAVTAACRAAGFLPARTIGTPGLHTMLGLVACGLGVGIGPRGMGRLHRDGVVVRPLDPAAATMAVHLAYRRDDTEPVPAAVRSALAAVRRRR